MTAYEQGISDILGIDIRVGTKDHLFHPSNYKQRLNNNQYIRRILSTSDIAKLMYVDIVTVRQWRLKGWLKGRHGAWRNYKNLKVYYWRYSLKDLEDCIMVMRTRKQGNNPIEHKTWTYQEIALAKHAICPEGRSRRAYYIKRTRLRKEGKIE